jgi:hypothetical protein
MLPMCHWAPVLRRAPGHGSERDPRQFLRSTLAVAGHQGGERLQRVSRSPFREHELGSREQGADQELVADLRDVYGSRGGQPSLSTHGGEPTHGDASHLRLDTRETVASDPRTPSARKAHRLIAAGVRTVARCFSGAFQPLEELRALMRHDAWVCPEELRKSPSGELMRPHKWDELEQRDRRQKARRPSPGSASPCHTTDFHVESP